MSKMRAKMECVGVQSENPGVTAERLTFRAVAAKSYGTDGLDEDNTYAHYSPQADLSITVANPALYGQFKVGEKYYVDFTKAE